MTRHRPLKRFRVKVAVVDSDHNELAVADLRGEVDIHDVPQVNVVVQERVVQVPVLEDMEPEREQQETNTGGMEEGDKEERLENAEGRNANATTADTAETEAVASPVEEMDGMVDNEMTDLEAILETVMGREWFQLFVHRQVDAEMVRKRWGPTALEIFQVNRDMMEMAEEQQQRGVGPRAMEMRMGDGDANVRRMSDDDSSESSGAKVFPARTVVAGRREQEDAAGTEADRPEDAADCEGEERSGQQEGTASGHAEGGQQEEVTQQVLENTQLELMDVMDSEGADATTAPGTTSATEGSDGDSFGVGKIQTDLQGWLK